MYTDEGNMLVHKVVMTARQEGWSWDKTDRHLTLLAKAHPKRAGEATDTVVREAVYTVVQNG